LPSRKGFLLLLLLAAMETLAGFAIIVGSSLLDALPPGYAVFWPLLGSAAAGLAFGLVVARIGPGDRWNRAIVAVGAVATGLGGAAAISHNLPSFLIAAFVLVLLFWRGIVITQEQVDHDDVLRRFGWGFGFLFFGIVWIVARGIVYQRPIWQMMALIGIGYTIVGMVALGTSRLEQEREPGAAAAAALAILFQLALLAGISLAVLQLFSLDVAGGIWHVTRPAFDRLGGALFQLELLIASPIQHFVDLIRPRGRRLANPALTQPANTQPTGKKPRGHRPLNDPLVVGSFVLFAVAALGGVLWLISRVIPRLPHRAPNRGYVERRRGLISLSALWQLLAGWIIGLFARSGEAAVRAVRQSRRRIFGDYPADPVRRVYAQLMRRAARAEAAPLTATTPLELATQLARRWPDHATDFARITEIYIQRRYAEATLAATQVAEIRERWHTVRPAMRPPRARPKGPADRGPLQESAGSATGASGQGWLARARAALSLPDPTEGAKTPGFGASVMLSVVSFAAPVILIIALLVVLALISGSFGAKHGLPEPGDVPLLLMQLQ